MNGWMDGQGGKQQEREKEQDQQHQGRLLCFILLFYSLAINPSMCKTLTSFSQPMYLLHCTSNSSNNNNAS